ncbi:hypothetical protein [Nostoc favosum]|uniref:Arc-like DNA binding domain-containing protein n=1 Tax=Nostoc favosum CHAB5714 TaxID=2780399 RepID=A0ABS8IA89_9NOSO|nr:hypothetical protein [Nostoc favosum]MCC5601020.1 hypothetical protein [Nostoc favosum CHAB5714]
MNFPPQLQQKIEKWASSQGISTEQFVLQAIAEKIATLSQQVTEEDTQQNSSMTNVLPLKQPNIYRKEGILVVEAELPETFDVKDALFTLNPNHFTRLGNAIAHIVQIPD